MSGKAYRIWLIVGFDMWMLGAVAASVMALRIARIAAGSAAGAAEVGPMVTEEVRAAIELQGRLMTGVLGHASLSGTQGALKHYQREVATNSKRLSWAR